MKLTDILTERLSEIVFHATSAKLLLQILSKNVLLASPLFTKDQEVGKSYFFISTARSRTSPFIASLLAQDKPTAVLQLDGDKLNQKFKGKSVDYFMNRKNSEMEDRLFTDEQYVRNISDYIEQISIYIPPKAPPEDYLLQIQRLATDKGIPILFFNDKKHLISNNRKMAIDLGKTINDIKNPEPEKAPKVTKNLEALIFFYENDNPNNVPAKYLDYVKDLTIDQYRRSWTSDIVKELNGFYRNPEVIGFFKDIMKKERVHTIADLVNTIANKWKKKSNIR